MEVWTATGLLTLPVGMCLQDAGWRKSPWLGDPAARQSEYVTWRTYFQKIANQQTIPEWHLSQEDIQVSLVWGAQVLQRLAQQVRAARGVKTVSPIRGERAFPPGKGDGILSSDGTGRLGLWVPTDESVGYCRPAGLKAKHRQWHELF